MSEIRIMFRHQSHHLPSFPSSGTARELRAGNGTANWGATNERRVGMRRARGGRGRGVESYQRAPCNAGVRPERPLCNAAGDQQIGKNQT